MWNHTWQIQTIKKNPFILFNELLGYGMVNFIWFIIFIIIVSFFHCVYFSDKYFLSTFHDGKRLQYITGTLHYYWNFTLG